MIPFISQFILQLTEYHFVKLLYKSLVDWRLKTDYLQCNPNFHGNVRYYCILVYDSKCNFFACLLMVFTYKFHNTTFPFALIQPFADVHYQCKKDTDLKLHRLQPKMLQHSIFIPARSICREALTVPAFDARDEYIMVDVIDTDMFLCIRAMYP